MKAGLDNRAWAVLVDAQDDEEAFDLDAEFERGGGRHPLKQRRQRQHQPAGLEQITVTSRHHQRRAPSTKRLHRLAESRTPGRRPSLQTIKE
ncbi:MAG: hypothetical protein ACR2P2_15990 [Nakamurella sp.]